MANSFEVTLRGVQNGNVFTSFTAQVDNPVNRTVYVYFWHALGTPSFSQIEQSSNAFFSVQTIGANGSATYTPNIQNLQAGQTYSYQYTVTDQPTFDPADVIFRRPLSPPGTYTSAALPTFTDTTLGDATQGQPYSDGVSASNATSYTLISGMPSGLSLSTNNGSITGTPNVSGNFSITIDANNSFGSTRTTVSLSINPPAPVWTDQTVQSPAFIDAPYSDGVQATYATSYTVSSGSLPAGLSLNSSTGAITGTPTTEETQNFTIQASNATGTISTGLQIEVQSGLQPPTFTDDTLSGDLRVLISYSDSVSATDAESYAFSGDPVPGLSIDNSGNVTGTPTEQGTFDFDIDATNAAGTTSAPFSLTVKPGAKRFDGTDFVAVTTFKRYDGTEWVDVLQTKRYDGTDWVSADL